MNAAERGFDVRQGKDKNSALMGKFKSWLKEEFL